MNEHHLTGDRPDGPEALEYLLAAARPVPGAAYRGGLRRGLVALGPPAARPPHLGRLVALHAFAGVLLLLIGLLSVVAGIGPLGA